MVCKERVVQMRVISCANLQEAQPLLNTLFARGWFLTDDSIKTRRDEFFQECEIVLYKYFPTTEAKKLLTHNTRRIQEVIPRGRNIPTGKRKRNFKHKQEHGRN